MITFIWEISGVILFNICWVALVVYASEQLLRRGRPRKIKTRAERKLESDVLSDVLNAADAHSDAGHGGSGHLWIKACKQTDDIESAKRLYLWLLDNSKKDEDYERQKQ